jgi:hypothetical protein
MGGCGGDIFKWLRWLWCCCIIITENSVVNITYLEKIYIPTTGVVFFR